MTACEVADDQVERLRAAGRRADQQHARRHHRQRPQHELAGLGRARRDAGRLDARAGLAARPNARTDRHGRRIEAGGGRTEPAARTERADLVDQLAAKLRRGREFAVGLRLRDVVGGAQRQRAQAYLGVAAGERRRHQHDEIALLLQQTRQRGDPVDVGHVDVENDDVGIGALHLLDGFASAAQRGDDLEVGLGLDPARDQAAHDDGVVDHHHADRVLRQGGAGGWSGDGDAHATTGLTLRNAQF